MNVNDHFQKQVHPRLDRNDEFFSYRYFRTHDYCHSKADVMTPAKRNLLKICPKPLITAFTQGSVYFPYDRRHEVLKHIAEDAEAGSVMYWNQIAYDLEGKGCRFAVDIDVENRVLTNKDIETLAAVLRQTLKAYYPRYGSKPIDIFVSKCGPRLKEQHLSTGVHVVCHVKVTIEQAKQLIFGYAMRLKRCNTFDMNGVEVDSNIYKEKSRQVCSRMLYCNKIEDCPLCKNVTDKRQYCKFCDRDGKVISKSTYEPCMCLNPKTGLNDQQYFRSLNPSFTDVISNYSIWSEDEDVRSDYARPECDPMYTIENEWKQENKGRKRKAGSSTRTPARKKTVSLKNTDSSYVLIEEFINGLVWQGKKMWSDLMVDNIELTEGKRNAWIRVSGLGCTSCPYAGKNHKTNRIYFMLTRRCCLTVYCYSKSPEYSCAKPDTRVQFEVPGKIRDQIFGMDGPPSFYQSAPLSAGPPKFSFKKFVTRKAPNNQTMRRREDEDAHEQLLRTLTEFYNLNQK